MTTAHPRAAEASTPPRGAPEPPRSDDRIVTRGLTKVFAPRSKRAERAVDRLDLRVRHGEIFGLLGPNGAGKTTTIGMLTTRVLPTDGQAFVDGIDVVAQPARAKARIGVVPQSNTLDRSITVWENLYFHGRYFGLGRAASRRRSDELLERFRLVEKRDARVATLSGGMAQRLMIARALAHQPAVLFLDEPTTGLDPQSRIALWELLRALHTEGQTILLTTHYMEEADQLCDRLAIMDAGRILALGSPEELKRGVDADTILHLRADDALEELVREFSAVDGVTAADVHDDAVRVFAKGPHGLLARLVSRADQAGFRLGDISVEEPTLETVFISLTGKDLRE